MREMNPQSEDKNNFAFGHIEVKLQSATYPGKFLEVIKEKKKQFKALRVFGIRIGGRKAVYLEDCEQIGEKAEALHGCD